jgi:hypothetical protein
MHERASVIFSLTDDGRPAYPEGQSLPHAPLRLCPYRKQRARVRSVAHFVCGFVRSALTTRFESVPPL